MFKSATWAQARSSTLHSPHNTDLLLLKWPRNGWRGTPSAPTPMKIDPHVHSKSYFKRLSLQQVRAAVREDNTENTAAIKKILLFSTILLFSLITHKRLAAPKNPGPLWQFLRVIHPHPRRHGPGDSKFSHLHDSKFYSFYPVVTSLTWHNYKTR